MRDPPLRPSGCACATPPRPGGAGELRCGCGSLIARFVEGQVELKCRRCKRVWRIPLDVA